LKELEDAYEWLLPQTELHAPTWYNGAIDSINSLEENPERCPLAPESGDAGEPIRQLLYGDKRHAYRILFTVQEQKVLVLHLRHAARRK